MAKFMPQEHHKAYSIDKFSKNYFFFLSFCCSFEACAESPGSRNGGIFVTGPSMVLAGLDVGFKSSQGHIS